MLKRFYKKLKSSKAAFSLIEIIVAIALLGSMTVAIGSVIIHTNNNANHMLSENELQQNLTDTQDTIHDQIIGTNAGFKFWIKEGTNFISKKQDVQNAKAKVIGFYDINYETRQLMKQYYVFVKKDAKLFKFDGPSVTLSADIKEIITEGDPGKGQYKVDDETSFNEMMRDLKDKNVVMLSKNVSDVIFDFSKIDDGLISYTLKYDNGDVDYETSDTIHIRNDLSFNEKIEVQNDREIRIPRPIFEDVVFEYDGKKHYVVKNIEDYRGSGLYQKYVTITGPMEGLNAGNYHLKMELKQPSTGKKIKWDLSQEDIAKGIDPMKPIEIPWKITPKYIDIQWMKETVDNPINGDTLRWNYDGKYHYATCKPEPKDDVGINGLVPGEKNTPDIEVVMTDGSLFANDREMIGPSIGELEVKAVSASPNYKVKAKCEYKKLVIGKTQASVNISGVKGLTYDDNGSFQQAVKINKLTPANEENVYFIIKEMKYRNNGNVLVNPNNEPIKAPTHKNEFIKFREQYPELSRGQIKNAGYYAVWAMVIIDSQVTDYANSDIVFIENVEIKRAPTAWAQKISPSPYFQLENGKAKEQVGVQGQNVLFEQEQTGKEAKDYTCVVRPDSNHTWKKGQRNELNQIVTGYNSIKIYWSITKHQTDYIPPKGIIRDNINATKPFDIIEPGKINTPGVVKEMEYAIYSRDEMSQREYAGNIPDERFSTKIPQALESNLYYIYYRVPSSDNFDIVRTEGPIISIILPKYRNINSNSIETKYPIFNGMMQSGFELNKELKMAGDVEKKYSNIETFGFDQNTIHSNEQRKAILEKLKGRPNIPQSKELSRYSENPYNVYIEPKKTYAWDGYIDNNGVEHHTAKSDFEKLSNMQYSPDSGYNAIENEYDRLMKQYTAPRHYQWFILKQDSYLDTRNVQSTVLSGPEESRSMKKPGYLLDYKKIIHNPEQDLWYEKTPGGPHEKNGNPNAGKTIYVNKRWKGSIKVFAQESQNFNKSNTVVVNAYYSGVGAAERLYVGDTVRVQGYNKTYGNWMHAAAAGAYGPNFGAYQYDTLKALGDDKPYYIGSIAGIVADHGGITLPKDCMAVVNKHTKQYVSEGTICWCGNTGAHEHDIYSQYVCNARGIPWNIIQCPHCNYAMGKVAIPYAPALDPEGEWSGVHASSLMVAECGPQWTNKVKCEEDLGRGDWWNWTGPGNDPYFTAWDSDHIEYPAYARNNKPNKLREWSYKGRHVVLEEILAGSQVNHFVGPNTVWEPKDDIYQ